MPECLHTLSRYAPLLRICTGTEDIPWSECILPWWAVLICAHRLWFHPSELDNYRSLCSEPWSLLWRSLRLCRGNKGKTQQRSRQLLVSPECWDGRWLPDWFSGPFPIRYHHLSLSVSEVCSSGLIFWTRASQILARRALVCSCAWSLINEGKSSRVQFLTAEADNGGDWLKQFVTSSLSLTFTGCLAHRSQRGAVRNWC